MSQIGNPSAVSTGPIGPAGGDLAGTYPNPTLSTSIATAVSFTGLGLTAIAAAGSAPTPALSLTNFETGTGWYVTAAGKVGLSVSGTLRFDYGITRAAQWNFSNNVFMTSNLGLVGSGSVLTISNTLLTGPSAATLQLGAVAADTTGVSQTLQAQGVLTGGTNNQAGGNLTIQPGAGKGTAIASLIFKSPIALASGNTPLQTQTQSFMAKSGSLVVGPGSALSTIATDGFIYVAGGAGPPTGTPTANTGAIALYYDITNDQLYAYNSAWKQPKTPAGAAIVNWQ